MTGGSGESGPAVYNPAVGRRGREHERTEEERAQVALELRRVRELVRGRALHERDPGSVLGDPRATRTPEPVPREPIPAPEPPPARPDATAVNAAWRVDGPPPTGGLRGFLRRLAESALGPRLQAQRDFNARQVQLDNAILDYVDARFAATHRHYDAVLGGVGRHLGIHGESGAVEIVIGEPEAHRVLAAHLEENGIRRTAALMNVSAAGMPQVEPGARGRQTEAPWPRGALASARAGLAADSRD